MKGKLTLTALGCIALLLTIGTGSVVAAELTNTDVDPSDDTQSIRVVGENLTNDSASITVFETVDGSESEVATATLNTDESNGTYTDTYEYQSVNASNTYRVLVEGDGADSISVNKVNTVPASGGSASLSVNSFSSMQKVMLVGALAFFGALGILWYFRESIPGTRRY